ncbi:MAG: acetyltransferase [Clostridiales bacterium]|nr:acetyltransferase [Clostridiales bacterium]
MEKRLLLIGGGGHCRSVADTVLSLGEYSQTGIIDNGLSSLVPGITAVGTDEDLPRLKSEGWNYAFICVGSIGSTALRRKLYRSVKEAGFIVPTIIDKTACVCNSSIIEEGVFVGKRAVVNSGARIGLCAIINTGSIIEHDCRVGDFTHISPGAILCGNVNVGHDTHIGAGSVIRQSINIGSDVMIGVGSAVVKNIQDNAKAFGNPCRAVE